MSKEERVRTTLEDMGRNVIDVFNKYCESNEYWEERFEDMGSFDDFCHGMTATKILSIVDEDFNTDDEFFRDTIWGLVSWTEDEAYEEILGNWSDELVKYIIENNEDFGYSELEDALHEEDEE